MSASGFVLVKIHFDDPDKPEFNVISTNGNL